MAMYLSHKLYRDLFTPLCVYVSMWLACLLLFRLRLVNYFELETRTVILVGTSIVAFALGCVIAGRGRRPDGKVLGVSVALQQDRLILVIKTLLVLNFVGLLVFVFRMSSSYGLANYALDPSFIRGEAGDWTHAGLLGLLLMLDYPLLVCSWIHRLRTSRWQWFSFLGLLLPVVQTYLKLDRGTLTVYVITCLFVWIYWNGWRKVNWKIIRRLVMLGGLLFMYFLAIGLLLGKTVSGAMESSVYDVRDFNISSAAGLALASPYIYATGAFPTFQEAMADVHELSWGAHSFYPIARLFYGLGILKERPEGFMYSFYLVPIPFNTYTQLFAFYQDFGSPGVVFMPLFLGWFETRRYLQMRAHPDVFSLGATSALMVLNVFSVFIPLITGVSLWYCLLILYWISKYCVIRRPVLNPA